MDIIFLFHLSYIVLGFALISLFLVANGLSNGEVKESLAGLVLPLVIFIIIVITIGLVRLISYIRESKRLPQVVEVYDVAAGNVDRGRNAVREIDETEEGLQEIYTRFKSVQKREVEEIELFREEFDKANKMDSSKEKEKEKETEDE